MLFSQPRTKKMLGKCGAACRKFKPALGTTGDEAGKLLWQAGTSWDFHDSLGNFHDKHPPIWKHCSKRSKPFFQGFHKINLVARNPNEVKSHPHREINCQIQFLWIWFPSKNYEMTVFSFFQKKLVKMTFKVSKRPKTASSQLYNRLCLSVRWSITLV